MWETRFLLFHLDPLNTFFSLKNTTLDIHSFWEEKEEATPLFWHTKPSRLLCYSNTIYLYTYRLHVAHSTTNLPKPPTQTIVTSSLHNITIVRAPPQTTVLNSICYPYFLQAYTTPPSLSKPSILNQNQYSHNLLHPPWTIQQHTINTPS